MPRRFAPCSAILWRAAIALQADLSDYYGGLPQEMPGSLWPKTSLAALKEGTRLTPEQLKALIAICWCVRGGDDCMRVCVCVSRVWACVCVRACLRVQLVCACLCLRFCHNRPRLS